MVAPSRRVRQPPVGSVKRGWDSAFLWDHVTLEEFSVFKTAFISVEESIDTNSSYGQFLLTMLDALATLDSQRTGFNTRAVLELARKNSRVYCKTAPFE